MKILLILATFVTLCHTRPQGVNLGKGEELTVRFRSVNARSIFPKRFTLTLEHNRRDLELPASLHLNKNEKIDDVNFYVDDARVDANFENAAFYQDLTNHAVVTAKVMMKAGKPIRVVRGSFIANDVSYEIEPAPIDDAQEYPPMQSEAATPSDEEFEAHDHVVRQVNDVTQHMDKRAPKIEDLAAINATKRATDQYDVEMYWVTDYEFYKDWQRVAGHNLQNLKEYFAHQVNGMDIVFKSFNDIGLTVNVWVQKVEITTNPSTRMPTDESKIAGRTNPNNLNKQSINGQLTLNKMKDMRTARGYTHLLPDHLQLWTGWDIEGASVGLAPVSSICIDRSGNSIVENIGWHAWAVAAHELGHNMGMRHDGQNGCSRTAGNIMSPTVVEATDANREQVYKFSTCALKQCKGVLEGTNINGFKRNCLKTASCKTEFHVKPKLPGDIDDLNKMCEWQFGKGAMIASGCDSDPPSAETCLTLKCKKGMFCMYGTADDGSPCGTNKHCIQKECVAKSVQPPSVNKACKTGGGNPTVPEGCTDDMTCPMIKSNPQNCASGTYWRKQCCKTCTLYGYSP